MNKVFEITQVSNNSVIIKDNNNNNLCRARKIKVKMLLNLIKILTEKKNASVDSKRAIILKHEDVKQDNIT